MKQIIYVLIIAIFSFQNQACINSQAFAKATYIGTDKVYLPNEKITEATVIGVYHPSDEGLYEKLTTSMKSSLQAKKITTEVLNINVVSDPNLSAVGESKKYKIIVSPIKDTYMNDELNNPFISKQITVLIQKNNGEKVADIFIAIDRTKKDTKLATEISDMIFGYLKKKRFL